MRANISVHEPKQREDEETPLAFSMEGLNRTQPAALLPWVWSPGWNSNQSVHKFQTHAGGALKGGTAGVRLLQPGRAGASARQTGNNGIDPAMAGATPAGHWQLVPRPRIFGSDELSALSPALAELVVPGFIELCGADAAALGVTPGDGVEVGDGLATLAVRVNDSMAAGCAGYSTGFTGTGNLVPLQWASLRRAANWQRPPQVIGSDRETGRGRSHD
jgi:NADH-quinone oxidoreductase subunit G